jgi:hypothetical protein
MNEYLSSSTTHSMPVEVVLWLRTAVKSNRMKYARFLRDEIRNAPPELGKRLLREHLQREPRFTEKVVSETTVEWRYSRLL